ncbi:hypothetical protein HOF40_00170 [Candidatus Parcubacteria bacterium]|jgi:hypothetical protein|nr:hypothetical protein [Candidatus Parcubacteria bacterium]
MFIKNKKAFSLLEAVISIAIFLLFALGIYGGTQLVFKIVYSSRIRILETGILNEQVELVRNLSFYDVGVINGSPSGVLDRNVTTTRNGVDFLVTRTVRNIDDTYDGTVGGVPQDLAPADYKLVDISVICARCDQREPLSMQTYVAPKFLEGDPTHGALFIEVFDANAQAVQSASVHILSTSTDPTYDFTDTTDNDGMLRLVDMAEGFGTYNITISKDGYTSDGTLSITESIPNPTKPTASVIAQGVTEVSFSIDLISSISIETINSLCSTIPSVSFSARGTKLLGTDPDVYNVDSSYSTDGNGTYTFDSFEWDSYGFSISGYDLIGTIPDVPFALNPGVTQPIQLVVGPNTVNSLLVMVTDGGQPIANAQVHVTSTSFDENILTGVGSVRQTDWSNGSGQELFTDNTKYWTGSGVDSLSAPGDITLINVAGSYVPNGTLESSIIDVGIQAQYVSIEWESVAQPVEAGSSALLFQLASSASSSPATWEYLGPDGTSATYYAVDSQVIHVIHDGDQFVRYKAYLHTDDISVSPILSDVSLTYTNSCMPPGQAYFGGLSVEDHIVEIQATGFQTYVTTVSVSDDIVLAAELTSL